MNASSRREAIAVILSAAEGPVSAASLASRFSVSRQVIVGDMAILRAAGTDIRSTPRGYLLGDRELGIIRTVACTHGADDVEPELFIMVDNGCTVLDVVVEHPIYGSLTGELRLSSRYDVQQFAERLRTKNAPPLSALTGGTHFHNLLCPDEAAYERTAAQLKDAGILVDA